MGPACRPVWQESIRTWCELINAVGEMTVVILLAPGKYPDYDHPASFRLQRSMQPTGVAMIYQIALHHACTAVCHVVWPVCSLTMSRTAGLATLLCTLIDSH